MAVVYRVYWDSYEGGSTLHVFADEAAAIAYAQVERDRHSADFGYSFDIERLDSDTGEAETVVGWHDLASNTESGPK